MANKTIENRNGKAARVMLDLQVLYSVHGNR